MALLSDIVKETAENFGLGNRAGALVAETVRLMFSPRQGGLQGFLNAFDKAGLAELTRSWRDGSGPVKPIDGKQLESAIGGSGISEVGKKLGMANARVRTAMAFAIPQLVRLICAQGALPKDIPSPLRAFMESDAAKVVAPAGKPVPTTRPRKSRAWLWWLLGTLMLLGTAVVTGLQILKNQDKIKQYITHPRPTAAVDKPVQPIQEPEPGKPVAKLTIRNDGGRFEYTGEVSDIGMKANITEQLLTFFGQARLDGNLTIDPQIAVPFWLSKLDRVLPQLNVPGLDLRLEGNTVRVGGWLSDQDRESVMSSLKTALGPGFRYGFLGNEEAELALEAKARTLSALTALPMDYRGADLASVLNRFVMLFPEGSAALPEAAREFVPRAAEMMKKMPQPVVFEIAGHTDNQGNAAANLKLSQDRAVAIKMALMQAGVPELMLQAKGYGADRPVASNDTALGRFKNRRIEFSVLQVCAQRTLCGLPEPEVAQPEGTTPLPLTSPEPIERRIESIQTPAADSDGGIRSRIHGGSGDDRPAKSRVRTNRDRNAEGGDPGRSTRSARTPGDTSDRSGGAKSIAPKGRWIPQLPKSEARKPATAPAPRAEHKEAAKPKSKPAERKPSSGGAQDLF